MPRTWDSYLALGGRASNGCGVPTCGSRTVAEAAMGTPQIGVSSLSAIADRPAACALRSVSRGLIVGGHLIPTSGSFHRATPGDIQIATIKSHSIDIGDFQLTPPRGAKVLSKLHHAVAAWIRNAVRHDGRSAVHA